MNTNDTDWVEDVRRWYFNGGGGSPSVPDARSSARRAPVRNAGPEAAEIGYEAAHPNLQSATWPQPSPSNFGSLG